MLIDLVLFRVVTSVNSYCSTLLWYTQLVDKVRSGYAAGRLSSKKLARFFLFYLLSVVVFSNALGTGYQNFFPILMILRDSSGNSWGASTFSHVYSSLDIAY